MKIEEGKEYQHVAEEPLVYTEKRDIVRVVAITGTVVQYRVPCTLRPVLATLETFKKYFAPVAEEESDVVAHPSHYQIMEGVEVVKVIEALVADCDGKVAYQYGSVLKYILRCMKKNGVQDLKKAQMHLGWLIEAMESK